MDRLACFLIAQVVFLSARDTASREMKFFTAFPLQAIDREEKGSLGLNTLKIRRVLKFGLYIVYNKFSPWLTVRKRSWITTDFSQSFRASDFLISRSRLYIVYTDAINPTENPF